MKKIFVLFIAIFAFLTVFSTTALAASNGEQSLLASSLEGPMILLSFCTLGVMIFLNFKDHN